MFESTTKTQTHQAGAETLGKVLAEIPLPHVAIGGITIDNVPRLLAAGAERIAVSSAILDSGDPVAAARAFAQAL